MKACLMISSQKPNPNLEKTSFKPFENLLKSLLKTCKNLVPKSSSRELFIASLKN
jgi:hypothetical protein